MRHRAGLAQAEVWVNNIFIFTLKIMAPKIIEARISKNTSLTNRIDIIILDILPTLPPILRTCRE